MSAWTYHNFLQPRECPVFKIKHGVHFVEAKYDQINYVATVLQSTLFVELMISSSGPATDWKVRIINLGPVIELPRQTVLLNGMSKLSQFKILHIIAMCKSRNIAVFGVVPCMWALVLNASRRICDWCCVLSYIPSIALLLLYTVDFSQLDVQSYFLCKP